MTILIINGPNLNLLGTREPEIYGAMTLADIEKSCQNLGKELGLKLEFFQSNHEGELVDIIQKARAGYKAVIINAGAYTHTSIALLDALKILTIPIVEVHLSNLFTREEFRHHSYITPIAKGLICGFGADSYLLAIRSIAGMR